MVLLQGKIRKINKLLNERKISATELVRHYLKNTESLNPTLNAYITVCTDAALASAERADDIIAHGGELSPLCAIPVSVKDNINVCKVRMTCASKMLSDYESIYDAAAVEYLKDSGAVILGKTNMDEFAMGSTCENSYFGSALNPHNTDYVPGGSSGGAAVSVAADMAVCALGSDTGGSVRLPASFCGCVGLKPTYGSVSRYGLVAFASSFDQIGVISSCVDDAAVLFDTINRYDCKDATSSPVARDKTADSIEKNKSGLKIGVLKNAFLNPDSETENAVKSVLHIYEEMGAHICEVDIAHFEYLIPVYYVLSSAEAASNLARYDGVRYGYRAENYTSIDDMIVKSRTEGFGAEVKRRIMTGNYVLSADGYKAYYEKANLMRNIIRSEYMDLFNRFDVLISPTAPKTAFELGKFKDSPTDMYYTDMLTVSANLCGFPALSVPCGFDKNQLPMGVQLMGNMHSEALLFGAAYALENAIGDKAHKKTKIGGDELGI